MSWNNVIPPDLMWCLHNCEEVHHGFEGSELIHKNECPVWQEQQKEKHERTQDSLSNPEGS